MRPGQMNQDYVRPKKSRSSPSRVPYVQREREEEHEEEEEGTEGARNQHDDHWPYDI